MLTRIALLFVAAICLLWCVFLLVAGANDQWMAAADWPAPAFWIPLGMGLFCGYFGIGGRP